VIDDLVIVLTRYVVLNPFDLIIEKLDHVAGFDAHHVVVMFTTVQLEYGVTALEIVANHEISRLELRQNAIDGSQSNVLTGFQQLFVNVLGTQMPILAALEDFQNLQSRERDF
jgi:hypothetical protein